MGKIKAKLQTSDFWAWVEIIGLSYGAWAILGLVRQQWDAVALDGSICVVVWCIARLVGNFFERREKALREQQYKERSLTK